MKSPKSLFCFTALSLFLFAFACKKSTIENKPITVDAGVSQTMHLTNSPILLSGSIHVAEGRTATYLWSMVSGPNTPVIETPTLPQTLVTGYVSGNYVFQLQVTDNTGNIASDTARVDVQGPEMDTLYLQPDSIINEKHFFGNDTLDQSSQPAPELCAASWTTLGQMVTLRGAIQFDLSQIPADATINSAMLTLYSDHTPLNGNLIDANSGIDNTFFIQRITGPWDANTATWLTQPSGTDSNMIIVPTTDLKFLDVTSDVTAIVSDMVSGNQNFGFLIKLFHEGNNTSRIFCSSKHSDKSKHPKLMVVFTQN